MTYILFIFIGTVYIFLSFPVYSTGDGAEFSAIGFTLSIAHPSGYSLYSLILKFISFIPIGSISERMVLISVLFALLSLFILKKTLILLKIPRYISLIAIFLLSSIYSFFGQSIVIKFYTLNLFLISSFIYFVLKFFISKEEKYFFISIIIFGLISLNHHTGLFVLLSLILVILFNKFFNLRDYFIGFTILIFFFLLNFGYLKIRSLNDYSIKYSSINNFSEFINYYLRKNYSTSSLDSLNSAVYQNDFHILLFPLLNVSKLLLLNLNYFFILLLILGIFLLFKENKKLFSIFILNFFLYSYFLAKMTLAGENLQLKDWYISGHQYYLPMFFFSFIFIGLAVYRIVVYLESKNLYIAKKIFIFAVIFPCILNYVQRFQDQNFINNYVPYTYTKSFLASLPKNSLFLTQGDNLSFGIWYLKVLNNFRNDVCSLEYGIEDNKLYTRGCLPIDLYKNIYREFLVNNDLTYYAKNNKLFLNSGFPKDSVFNEVLDVKYVGLVYMAKEKNSFNSENNFDISSLSLKEQLFKTLLQDCLNHNSDDYYTLNLCRVFSNFYIFYGKKLEENGYIIKANEMYDIFFKLQQKNSDKLNFYSLEAEK